jgi:hypothetical protein
VTIKDVKGLQEEVIARPGVLTFICKDLTPDKPAFAKAGDAGSV